MKRNHIIGIIIWALSPMIGFGQIDKIEKQLGPSQLEYLHNSQQYVVQEDSNLVEFDTTTDNGLFIQNSYPKGGSYTSPTGKRFGYGVFWTRMVNETDFPIHITIDFPADSFPIEKETEFGGNLLDFSADSPKFFKQTNKYFKLFLPSDKMTLDKMPLFDYGATGVKLFLDTCLNEPTTFEKTILPKATHLFYVGMLMKVPDNGPVRTGIVIKDKKLFYRVSIDRQLDTVLIPCGRIAIRKRE